MKIPTVLLILALFFVAGGFFLGHPIISVGAIGTILMAFFIFYFVGGLNPVAGISLRSHALAMKANPLSPSPKPGTSRSSVQTVGRDLNQTKTASPPSQEAVARRAYAIYENEGSHPGHELKYWLEAEAQLLGGVEREIQMHPGSSLFVTEH